VAIFYMRQTYVALKYRVARKSCMVWTH